MTTPAELAALCPIFLAVDVVLVCGTFDRRRFKSRYLRLRSGA